MLVLLIAGGGYAIASGGSTIRACARKGTHVLYTGKSKTGDKKLSWGKVGPQGVAGARGRQGNPGTAGTAGTPGTPGTPGAPATKLFAAVYANATFEPTQSSGVTSVSSAGTGAYDVEFNQNVRGCTYIVGGGAPGAAGSGADGFYNATGRSSSVNGVYVATHNPTNAAVSNSFYVAVFC
jgi:hypothetical protein